MPTDTAVEAAQELTRIVEQLTIIVAEGEAIFAKAGGDTNGEIELAGETNHLKEVEAVGGRLWREALPQTSLMCKQRSTSESAIREAYATEGIFAATQVGTVNVAISILSGVDVDRSRNYFPISHLRGMLAALRAVLDYPQ